MKQIENGVIAKLNYKHIRIFDIVKESSEDSFTVAFANWEIYVVWLTGQTFTGEEVFENSLKCFFYYWNQKKSYLRV